MARARQNKNYFTFVGGLNTEATELTFPENASIDEANFALRKSGLRQRRLGIDYEGGFSLSSNIDITQFQDRTITTHDWDAVGGDSQVNFQVVQIGETIYFHSKGSASISANAKSFTIDLNTYKVSASPTIGVEPIDVTFGLGNLFVASKEIEPFYVEYDADLDSISATQINIKVRDFDGADDGLTIDDRPATLSDEHNYNLKNQGWLEDNVVVRSGASDPISNYNTANGEYPSNADIVYFGKVSSSSTAEDIGKWDASWVQRTAFGNTPAPSGHYILDAFNKDRATASGIGALTSETVTSRPSTVSFYAGRVWYSGVDEGTNSGLVFFSQTLETMKQAGLCYQDADPTSEDISDLIDTDGGSVNIPNSGKILRIIPINTSLVIFATNGLWQISGPDGIFAATDYSVNKITNIGVVGSRSMVDAEGTPIYWSKGGIYSLQADQVSGQLSAVNITADTIQTYYNDTIPEISKEYVSAVYDNTAKKVYWAWNEYSGFDGSSSWSKYNRLLILDVNVQAFYPYKIEDLASDSPYIADLLVSSRISTSTSTQTVVVGSDVVEVGTGNSVTVDVSLPGALASKLKFLVAVPEDSSNYKYTIGEFNNTDFVDWETNDGTGIDFTSYLYTGYELFGDAMREKDAPYLFMYFRQTEDGFTDDGSNNLSYTNPSAATVQIAFGWSNLSSSGRWSQSYDAYRLKDLYIPEDENDTFGYPFEVVTSKERIKGHGEAIQFRITSQTGKDMRLLGWSGSFTGETDV